MLKIYRLEPGKDDEIKRVFHGNFKELPAPEVTLGGYLLALSQETGFDHIAEEA